MKTSDPIVDWSTAGILDSQSRWLQCNFINCRQDNNEATEVDGYT